MFSAFALESSHHKKKIPRKCNSSILKTPKEGGNLTERATNLEEQLGMGGRREVSIISHRPVTSSDLKLERLFFRECLNIFATGCSL